MAKAPKTEEQLKAEAEAKAKKEAEKAAKEAEKAAAKAAKEAEKDYQFDCKKLYGAGAGLWKYAEDPKLVSRETFQQLKAKDYGIKANDVIFVSLNGEVEVIGV